MKFFKKKKSVETNDFSLKVIAIEHNTADALIVGMEIPDEKKDVFCFQPGQYIDLETTIAGNKVRRSYSICSTPQDKLLKVGIKKVNNGLFSSYAHNELNVGDELLVSPPQGRFVLDSSYYDKSILAFATGSGITPLYSILHHFLQADGAGHFTLMYSNKSPEDTMFHKELLALQEQYPDRLTIHWVFTQSSKEGALFGRIDKGKANFAIKNSNPDAFFLCGQQPMTEMIRALLIEKGFDNNQIRYELFATQESTENKPSVNSDETSQINIILDGKTYTFPLSRKKAVLDGALKQQIEAPYSCQGGVCASCMGRIVKGKVHIAVNHVLTDQEIAEGLTITCQSYPITDELTISYDDL